MLAPQCVAAIRLAVEDVHGGVWGSILPEGVRLRVVSRDTHGDVEQTVRLVREMAGNASVIIGPDTIPEASIAATMASLVQTPVIAPTATSGQFDARGALPFFFRMAKNLHDEGLALADLVEALQVDDVMIFAADDERSVAAAKVFRAELDLETTIQEPSAFPARLSYASYLALKEYDGGAAYENVGVDREEFFAARRVRITLEDVRDYDLTRTIVLLGQAHNLPFFLALYEDLGLLNGFIHILGHELTSPEALDVGDPALKARFTRTTEGFLGLKVNSIFPSFEVDTVLEAWRQRGSPSGLWSDEHVAEYQRNASEITSAWNASAGSDDALEPPLVPPMALFDDGDGEPSYAAMSAYDAVLLVAHSVNNLRMANPDAEPKGHTLRESLGAVRGFGLRAAVLAITPYGDHHNYFAVVNMRRGRWMDIGLWDSFFIPTNLLIRRTAVVHWPGTDEALRRTKPDITVEFRAGLAHEKPLSENAPLLRMTIEGLEESEDDFRGVSAMVRTNSWSTTGEYRAIFDDLDYFAARSFGLVLLAGFGVGIPQTAAQMAQRFPDIDFVALDHDTLLADLLTQPAVDDALATQLYTPNGILIERTVSLTDGMNLLSLNDSLPVQGRIDDSPAPAFETGHAPFVRELVSFPGSPTSRKPRPLFANLRGAVFWDHQPAYFAGVLAGLVAGRQRRRVAMLRGSGASIAATRMSRAFAEGVLRVCPVCRVVEEFLPPSNLTYDAFDDLVAGVERGSRMATTHGADVVFASAAGLTGSKALETAAAHGAWVVGSEWDEFLDGFGAGGTHPNASRILTSVVRDLRRATRTMVASAFKRAQARAPATSLPRWPVGGRLAAGVENGRGSEFDSQSEEDELEDAARGLELEPDSLQQPLRPPNPGRRGQGSSSGEEVAVVGWWNGTQLALVASPNRDLLSLYNASDFQPVSGLGPPRARRAAARTPLNPAAEQVDLDKVGLLFDDLAMVAPAALMVILADGSQRLVSEGSTLENVLLFTLGNGFLRLASCHRACSTVAPHIATLAGVVRGVGSHTEAIGVHWQTAALSPTNSRCPLGAEFVEGEGNTAEIRAWTGSCRVCAPGTVSRVQGEPCRPCPAHSLCFGGSHFAVEANYWEGAAETIYSCPPNSCCVRGGCSVADADGQRCANGRRGTLCTGCADGFTLAVTDEGCVPCDGPHWGILSALFVTSLVVVALVAFASSDVRRTRIHILVDFVHLAALAVSPVREFSFRLNWGVLNMDLTLGPFYDGCILDLRQTSRYLAPLIFPAFLVAAWGILFAVARVSLALYACSRPTGSSARGEGRPALPRLSEGARSPASGGRASSRSAALVAELWWRFLAAAWVVFFMVFTALIRVGIGTLLCREVEGDRVLEVAPDVPCTGPLYSGVAAAFAPIAILLAVPFPLYLWVRIRHLLQRLGLAPHHPAVSTTLVFLSGNLDEDESLVRETIPSDPSSRTRLPREPRPHPRSHNYRHHHHHRLRDAPPAPFNASRLRRLPPLVTHETDDERALTEPAGQRRDGSTFATMDPGHETSRSGRKSFGPVTDQALARLDRQLDLPYVETWGADSPTGNEESPASLAPRLSRSAPVLLAAPSAAPRLLPTIPESGGDVEVTGRPSHSAFDHGAFSSSLSADEPVDDEPVEGSQAAPSPPLVGFAFAAHNTEVAGAPGSLSTLAVRSRSGPSIPLFPPATPSEAVRSFRTRRGPHRASSAQGHSTTTPMSFTPATQRPHAASPRLAAHDEVNAPRRARDVGLARLTLRDIPARLRGHHPIILPFRREVRSWYGPWFLARRAVAVFIHVLLSAGGSAHALALFAWLLTLLLHQVAYRPFVNPLDNALALLSVAVLTLVAGLELHFIAFSVGPAFVSWLQFALLFLPLVAGALSVIYEDLVPACARAVSALERWVARPSLSAATNTERAHPPLPSSPRTSSESAGPRRQGVNEPAPGVSRPSVPPLVRDSSGERRDDQSRAARPGSAVELSVAIESDDQPWRADEEMPPDRRSHDPDPREGPLSLRLFARSFDAGLPSVPGFGADLTETFTAREDSDLSARALGSEDGAPTGQIVAEASAPSSPASLSPASSPSASLSTNAASSFESSAGHESIRTG